MHTKVLLTLFVITVFYFFYRVNNKVNYIRHEIKEIKHNAILSENSRLKRELESDGFTRAQIRGDSKLVFIGHFYSLNGNFFEQKYSNGQYKSFINHLFKYKKTTTLVLGGDYIWDKRKSEKEVIDRLKEKFPQLFLLKGNHEFNSADTGLTSGVFEIDDVTFYLSGQMKKDQSYFSLEPSNINNRDNVKILLTHQAHWDAKGISNYRMDNAVVKNWYRDVHPELKSNNFKFVISGDCCGWGPDYDYIYNGINYVLIGAPVKNYNTFVSWIELHDGIIYKKRMSFDYLIYEKELGRIR